MSDPNLDFNSSKTNHLSQESIIQSLQWLWFFGIGSYQAWLPLVLIAAVSIAIASRQSLKLHITKKREWPKYLLDSKILLRYVLPETATDRKQSIVLLSAILLCISIGRAINLLSPILVRGVLANLDAESKQFSLYWIISYVFLVYFFKDFVFFIQWTLSRRFSHELRGRINIVLYNKLMTLSNDYHDKNSSTTLWSTVTDGGYTLSTFASSVAFDIAPSITDLVLATISFGNIGGLRLSATMIVVLICYVFVLIKTSSIYQDDAAPLSDATRKRDKQASETISNWTTVTVFNRQDHEKQVYRDLISKHAALDAAWCDRHVVSYNAKNLVTVIGVFLLCAIISKDIWEGKRDKADLVMFLHLWTGLTRPLDDILTWNDKLQSFASEAERLTKMLLEEPSVKDKPDSIDYQPVTGSIEVENVSFRYQGKDKDALRNVSCTIEGQSQVVIVGQSGGGKSTLLKLLLRCYNISEGSIKLDGHNIDDLRKTSILKHIGYVPQDVKVFNTTVLENVRYPRPEATEEQCEEALRAVALDHLKTNEVGDRGSNLSGGELQRLAIARVLIQDPKIVLLDEASSHLDTETEAKIQKYLEKWSENKTVVRVVHSFRSVPNTARVIAIKEGQVIEQGSLSDLITRKGYVYDLWHTEQSEPLATLAT